jgi:adenylate cyclase
MTDSDQQRRGRLAGALGFCWGVAVLAAHFSGVLEDFDELLRDRLLMLPARAVQTDTRLALIAIDRIPSDRPWPWPRLDYALLLRGLLPYAPENVVFEMLLNDRDTQYSAFDSSFAAAVSRQGRVTFAAAAMVRNDGAALPEQLPKLQAEQGTGRLPQFGSVLWPLETFSDASAVGITNLLPEESGRIRRIPLVFRLRNHLVPSLILQAAADRWGADLSKSVFNPGESMLLRNAQGRELQRIPVDDEGRLLVRFRQQEPAVWTAAFDNVLLYADQSDRGLQPERNLRELRGRQVWIGRTDRQGSEILLTPAGPISPVELQMLAVSKILSRDFLRPVPAGATAAFFLLFAVLLAPLFVRWGAGPAVAMVGASAWVVIEGAILGLRLQNWTFPIVGFVLLAAGLFVVGYATRHWEWESLPASEDKNQLPLDFKEGSKKREGVRPSFWSRKKG